MGVLHAGATEAAHDLAADLGQQIGVSDVMIMELTPAIVTHAGTGGVGGRFL
ncbi:MAG: hypothetical protein V9H69_10765 [Anaerolineae bacterium]